MSRKYIIPLMLLLALTIPACRHSSSDGRDKQNEEKVTVTIFAAKSLNTVVDELINQYEKDHENVKILANYDSSGTLMEQIKEGAECDLYFSAAQKQMDELEGNNLILPDSRKNVVNNQLCLVSYKGSNTRVTGLANIEKASSIALADGSVPVGKYTRQAMVNAGILPAADDVSRITTEEIAQALGNIEINECANVGAVALAVSEAANEVGTVYKSDTTGYEDRLDIIEVIPYELTGDVIYPIAQVKNTAADDTQMEEAGAFLDYLTSEEAKAVYQKYYFDTDLR